MPDVLVPALFYGVVEVEGHYGFWLGWRWLISLYCSANHLWTGNLSNLYTPWTYRDSFRKAKFLHCVCTQTKLP